MAELHDKANVAVMLPERHYTLQEIAKELSLSDETVRKLVLKEPGVVKVKLGVKQARTHYRVPESVKRRIAAKLLKAA